MKLWLLTQKVCRGYDTYDSCVVAAEDKQSAKRIHPAEYLYEVGDVWWDKKDYTPYLARISSSWPPRLEDVSAEYLGEARDGMPCGLVCSSFNAG